jgi:AcrR family transcriptional regulator
MSKVDRRITKSQESIRKAVIELMSEKSFDDITIQDIANRANVNRGTIYLHYVDKFDLLDKLIDDHINELRVMCESAVEMDLDFVDSNVGWFEYFESHYVFFFNDVSK